MGPQVGLRHARKHLAAYCDDAHSFGLGLSPSSRTRLLTSVDHREVRRILAALYSDREGRDAA